MLYRLLDCYHKILRWLVFLLAGVAGLGIFVMIIVTCLDVLLRRFGVGLIGAYDIVKISGAITLSCALPYTTAVKGHVAIEYFFHKFSKPFRIIIDTTLRLMGISLFAFLCYRSLIYGNELYKTGQVTQTLQLPIFWLAYIIAFCCFIVLLVILYNMTHPNREMIKP